MRRLEPGTDCFWRKTAEQERESLAMLLEADGKLQMIIRGAFGRLL